MLQRYSRPDRWLARCGRLECAVVERAIENAPTFMRGLRALYVSDTHVLPRTRDADIRALIDRVAALSPDLLLLGGDYADRADDALRLFDALAALRFPLGAFACLGNNDAEAWDSPAALREAMAGRGLRLLVNEAVTIPLKGGAIRRLAMAVANGKKPQALRSTVLEISFDGERTVWAPVGEFFGCGYTYESYSSWFTSCPGVGRMESRWTMPFERECSVTVRNLGDAPVVLSTTAIEVGPYRWDSARSMHFGACWHEYADAPSRKGTEKLQYDYDYAELEGEGLFVGTTIAIWQPATKWWGEGDEKVFVDGEAAPSYIGTGSEDYYGYAWGRYNVFDHPFIAQPVGIGKGRQLNQDFPRRNVVNIRNRALDAIPFRKSIRFHMEMWHWLENIKLDFAPLACWYMRPGGRANHGADPAAVRRPVRVDVPLSPATLPATATLFADFEDGTYGAWKATGEAFGPGPARGVLPFQNPVSGYSGRYLINTYYKKDDTKGTLVSPEFTVEKPFVNFLVGGGNYKGQTCVNLVVDGKVVRTVTGKNSERLEWTCWDVSEFKGSTAKIVVVDDRTGHFGHINADCFYFDISPRK